MTYQESLMEHNRRMRTDPAYRMLEMMEDMRVDMIPGRGTIEEEEVTPAVSEPQWNKRQWDIVDQLRNEQKNIRKLIYETLKENKTKNASKRETYTIK